jgi:DNA-binding FadR family transcriptional regulator
MFSPLPGAPSSVDRCAEAVRQAIVRRELAPGARLPPERALAATLGVDRTTVRMALQQIAREGLVSVRQGSGYRVRDFRAAGGPDLVPALIEAARAGGDPVRLVGMCTELLRVRRWLAGALLEAVASRQPDEASLAAIDAAVDALAAQDPADVAAVAQADLAVVHAWVDAADSVVLGLFVNPVGRVLGGLPALRAAIYADPAVNVAAWRAVAAAWREGALDLGSVLAGMAAQDRAAVGALALL